MLFGIVFFLKDDFSAEIYYKTHDNKLLIIIAALKTLRLYFQACKHKSFIFIDKNNFECFINTKKLNFW